ncbi:MAG: hypothetical protein ACXAEF_03755 [Candidatus Thorarchaeota archaeon]|jgi:hypothetical protein
MSVKNASIKTLVEDLKVSFKFASKNVINFLLAMIGVAIVSGIILGAIAAVILPLIFISGSLDAFMQYMIVWIETYQTFPGVIALLSIFILVSPLLAPFLVAFGALYGMGREIVESEGTTAEGVFSWYSKKFLSLGGAGLLQFFIIITPIAIVAGLLAPYGFLTGFGSDQLGLASVVLGILLVYLGFMSGFLSMMFPAVIDGHSVIASLKISLRLSTKYFDRVFSNWFAYLGIFGAIMIPIVVPTVLAFPAVNFQAMAWLGVYGSLMGLFTILIFMPAIVIGMSRIYMILISENVEEGGGTYDPVFSDSASNDVDLFGGE